MNSEAIQHPYVVLVHAVPISSKIYACIISLDEWSVCTNKTVLSNVIFLSFQNIFWLKFKRGLLYKQFTSVYELFMIFHYLFMNFSLITSFVYEQTSA